MRGKFVGKDSLLTHRQWEARETATKVYTTIRRICEKKKAEGITPARATWRELRDEFEDKHFRHLEFLVEQGVATKVRAINYDTYEIDYPAWEALVRRLW